MAAIIVATDVMLLLRALGHHALPLVLLPTARYNERKGFTAFAVAKHMDLPAQRSVKIKLILLRRGLACLDVHQHIRKTVAREGRKVSTSGNAFA